MLFFNNNPYTFQEHTCDFRAFPSTIENAVDAARDANS
jgi:hypothetical protein